MLGNGIERPNTNHIKDLRNWEPIHYRAQQDEASLSAPQIPALLAKTKRGGQY